MNLTKSSTAKLAAGIVGFAMVVTAFMPVLASADTASDLQAQINSLLATIQSLQAQLSATTGGSSGYTFNTNLTVGSTGADVMNLQKVLNKSADTQVASSGVGSPGNESSYFGGLTKAAVIKFQTKNGISPAAGYVGPITRAKLNTMGGSTGGTTTTTGGTLPTGGALMISSATQPANSLAPKGAARVPFTRFTLTAGANDVTVNSVTVQRSGFAQDAVFAGVVLLNNDGMQVGIAKTLNSNHQAMVGEPFVVKAGTSQTYTVAGNMASSLTDYVGQVASLDVVAVNSSASVSGSLPITGAQQTVNNSLTVGTVTVNTSSFDPNNAGSQSIGTTNFRFSGLRITAGSAEDLTFKSIRWNQSGSAGSSDLSNVVTVVNGTQYPTTVSSDGKYFSTVFPSGIVVTKGNSVDVYIQGDLTGSGSAGRIAEFDVYKNTDIYLVGNTYGYGITAPVGTGTVSTDATHVTVNTTTSNPWFQGSTLSITAGTVTLIAKANEVASQNIAVNVSNQVLGGFATNFDGEPVSVQNLYFVISTTSSVSAAQPQEAITSVTLIDENGAVVAGPVDAGLGTGTTHGNTALGAGYNLIHFTDTVTFPKGRHVYTLKGKIPSDWVSGTTVTIYTKPSTDFLNATGQTTGNTVTISTAVFSMNQMTVKGAALSVNISAQPTSQNIVAGVQNFVLANYTLNASQSGEDVRMSSFPVEVLDSTLSNLSGCQLYNGATALNTGSSVKNFTNANSGNVVQISLDNSLVIPKGTIVTLAFQCNVASGATDTFRARFDNTIASSFTVTGQTSGNTVVPTVGTADGGIMTPQTGGLAMSIDASSPSYAVVAGGSTGVTVGVIKFRASNESMTLTKVGLNLNVGTASDVITAYLYNGSQLLGSANFAQGSASATSTLGTTLNLPKDTDVLVTVKADFAAIGTSQSGTEGIKVQVDPLNAEVSGQSSGTTIATSYTGGSHVAGIRTFKSYPTIALDTLSSNGIADGKFMRFKVTASNSGPVGLDQFVFTIATTSVTVSNVSLYAYTDPGYSSPISGQTNGQVSNGALALVYPADVNPALATATPATNPIQVPAGGTLYFELRGSVASVVSGSTVVTTLKGDAAYPSWLPVILGSVTSYVATSTGTAAVSNFIWSGNATSTAAKVDVDWSNAFGLSGYSSSGLIQTRSQ